MSYLKKIFRLARKRSSPHSTTSIELPDKQFSFYGLLPPNVVEVDATQEQLELCSQKIGETWSGLGSEKAHFSVITDPQYLPENLENSLDSFWQSGINEANRALLILKNTGKFDGMSLNTCVEYGCGVGRVTMGLAKHFKQVHAYDISEQHLEHATHRAKETNTVNIDFHPCLDFLHTPLESCDLFYSKIVFQHNPPPLSLYLIKKALESLNPSGIAIFQVPVYRIHYTFKFQQWLKTRNEADMEMHCLPQHHIFQTISDASCVLLAVWEDNATGAPDKFISNTFVIQKKT